MRTTTAAGMICLSVETLEQVEGEKGGGPTQPHYETAELLERFGVPSNWIVDIDRIESSLPPLAELTGRLPAVIDHRGKLVHQLQAYQTQVDRAGRKERTVAVDPYQVQKHWDVFARQACFATMHRSHTPNRGLPHVVRGGVWSIPVSCSFVGGATDSVRSQYGNCHRRLLAAAQQGSLFHLCVNVAHERSSWSAERDAFQSILHVASEQAALGRLRFVTLGTLPRLLGRRNAQPTQQSILRRAA